MAFSIPSTWKFHSSQGNGNQVTYTRPGHTVQAPRLAIVSRVVPVYDAKTARWSVPSYRVRVFDGVVDAVGNPDPTKTLVDLTCRASVSNGGAARGDEVTSDLLVIINQADFASAAFVNQDFPVIAAV